MLAVPDREGQKKLAKRIVEQGLSARDVALALAPLTQARARSVLERLQVEGDRVTGEARKAGGTGLGLSVVEAHLS